MKEIKIAKECLFTAMKKTQVFYMLSEDLLAEITENSQVLEYQDREIIITEGEISSYFYVILGGAVSVTADRNEKKGVFICSLGSGDIFGEASIFLDLKRTAHVTAENKAMLLRIERKYLLKFIRKNSGEGVKILMIIIYSLLKKLREANQELAFERKSNISDNEIDSLIASMK
ncbi:MAG: hypothetical protein A2096_02690 [Spirochaetes bacterium GWF1_41_5]|nr:MAG: hypothetical protein A2096_02690 [Spirochaetes bacterium GWF1_41_5]HBE03718.1 hypothetical protein [Spirochaetia bacterium]